MFPRKLTSMYQTATAEGQWLSWELKVAAQRQKLFLQEIEERLIVPLPPAASERHTGQKRKGTGSVVIPSNLADPDFQVPANTKKSQYSVAVPRTRNRNSPILVPLDSMQPAVRALQLRVEKDGTLPTNPTEYFNFVVDTC